MSGTRSSARLRAQGPRFVVPSEAHVERLARSGHDAETRTSLRRRLIEELAPDVVLARPDVTRLALTEVLPRVAEGDPLLAPIAREGGRRWRSIVDAVDEAVALVRAMRWGPALARIANEADGDAQRARLLSRAIVLLDEALARAGLVDRRAAGAVLARAIGGSPVARVADAARGTRLVARAIVSWDPSELEWWRALDVALRAVGGRAAVELPGFDLRLDAERARNALETVADEVAAGLDEPPEIVPIDAPLGDLRGDGPVPPSARERIELRAAADATAQARAVADAVHSALASGTPVEAIAIGVANASETVVRPIRRALDDACVVVHDAFSCSLGATGVVALAFDVLAVAERGLARTEVAWLLRSRYVDARRVTAILDFGEARRALGQLARALEQTPSVTAEDPARALAATVLAWRPRRDPDDNESGVALASLAQRVGEILRSPGEVTRAAHIAWARRVWTALGIAPRFGRDVRDTFASDTAATGIARAELRATVRDARAWERLVAALDAYEAAALRLGIRERTISPATFQHELRDAFEAAVPRSSPRAGAVRIARLEELAAEPLTLLVVIDVNEGVFPSAPLRAPILSVALAERLREVTHAPSPARRGGRELAELAFAVSSAKSVVLAWRSRDDDGAILAPAPIVTWLEHGGVRTSVWRASAVSDRPLHRDEATLVSLAAFPDRATAIAPRAARRASIERAREAFFDGGAIAGDRVAVLDASDLDHRLIAHLLEQETGGGTNPVSVTALERFAVCAFQGYASHVLRAKGAGLAGDAPDARDVGILVHGALAASFRATADLWRLRPRDAETIRARALSAARLYLSREVASSGLRRLSLDHVLEDVAGVVEWSLADETWDFAEAEQAFGDASAGSWEAVRIEGEGVRASVRGSIDRVDVARARNAVRAIDYKLGETSARVQTKEMGDTAFQLPLYARAAAAHYAAGESEGLYLPTSSRHLLPGYSPKGHAAAWARAHADGRFESRLLAVLSAVRSGALAPVPRDARACERCELDGVCRKPRFSIDAARPDDVEGDKDALG